MRALLLFLLLPACLDLALEADLEGPRLVGGSLPLPRNVEVPTLPAIVLDFSEPLDPASVRAALVPWADVGRCDRSPVCAEGSCERGRCQVDPLSAADLARAEDRAPDGGVPLAHVLEDSPAGPDSRLALAPRRALRPYARHSLVVFVRDRSGAPLVDERGRAAALRRDLVTAGEGSGGPEARLVAPPPDTVEVPPNLARVATAFARPVAPDPAAVLHLRAADGGVVPLVDPAPCDGWVPGLCLTWRPAAPVREDMAYRPDDGTLRDTLGRPAVPPAAATWFATAAAADRVAPDLAGAALAVRGPCVVAGLVAAEPLALELRVGDRVDRAVTPGGPVALALRGAVGPAALAATDLAGNHSARTFEAVPGASFDPDAPPLGLAEVLANPRGAEPTQEFVELADLRDDGGPREHADLFLADLPWPEVAAATDPPGDPLPTFRTTPGARLLVVAASYDPHAGEDPPPAPGTPLVRVDGSLAAGGLKNAGEPLTLFRWPGAGPPTLVAAYGDHVATDAPAHAGRSVVADPRACDLARAWRSHPAGSASPGAAP